MRFDIAGQEGRATLKKKSCLPRNLPQHIEMSVVFEQHQYLHGYDIGFIDS